MSNPKKPSLPTSDLLGILGIIVGIVAMLDFSWAIKCLLILLAILLIIYAGRRHNSCAILKYPIAAAAIWYFSFAPWASIWADIHKNHVRLTWPEVITWPVFHWLLAISATLTLVWDWRPFELLRHPFRLWRLAVGEEAWIDRQSALKMIRDSEWAATRRPPIGLAALIAGMSYSADKDRIQFERFLELTLDSFDGQSSSNTKMIGEKRYYAETRLLHFLDAALNRDVIKRFGDVP